ncbi:hypothetical protein E4T66_17465 [Sinimarinibacterium sp. CAU 1509]|uniref:hypothetical protein n=1 Tax=Sinimarinibacterium sp. CAU 1509 TaxID=2562283 RepID=UPI0010AC5C8D|nr:hypothetical protein [Sinimarinibacterium sp. CAU 1509]TJY57198.1 hypothetical protein E4T66_17465 [Sinimarinibacterium sp. CAU 1509]
MPATAHKPPTTLLRWRETNTPHGVTKELAAKAAAALGFTETQLVHEALAYFLPRALPQYDPDFDLLTEADLVAIRARVPQEETGTVLSSIID